MAVCVPKARAMSMLPPASMLALSSVVSVDDLISSVDFRIILELLLTRC